MPNIKTFWENKLVNKTGKIIFRILPLIVIGLLYLYGYIDIHSIDFKHLDKVIQDNVVILFCSFFAIVLYYKATSSFFYILPFLAAFMFLLTGVTNINLLPTRILIRILSLQGSLIYIIIGLIIYYVIVNKINGKVFRIRNTLSDVLKLPYTSEFNIVGQLANWATGANEQDFFPMAFAKEAINIKAYKDPDETLSNYKSYDFDLTNKSNPLLEKELFRQLEKTLEKKGLTRNAKNPQIIISIDFFNGKKEQYTPPTTVTSTELKSVWNVATLGWSVGGFSSQVPVTSSSTIAGYTTTSYYSNIRLNFLNHAKLAKGGKLETPPLIWLGEADNQGLDSDIRGIAPVMFEKLLSHFSDNSENSKTYFVQRFRYSGLGLGFNPKDWRVVRNVEALSVAAENNIKPGDTILFIDKTRPGNWPTYNRWYSASTWTYRSTDPYFLKILSNRGDSEVEVQIVKADSGKRVTLKMKPRYHDRYVNVSI